MKVAMISYNTIVVDDNPPGWREENGNAVFLLQSEDVESSVAETLDQLKKSGLGELMTMFDAVVFYFGKHDIERLVRFAAESGLTPDRAIFVACSCDFARKRARIAAYGFGSSQIVASTCGGNDTLRALYEHILAGGALPTG